MTHIVWLAANGLRWLTVAAVLAWMNPQPLHIEALGPPVTSVTTLRTIQLAPCPAWATKMGRWYTAYVCATDLWSHSRYRAAQRRLR